MTLGITLRDRKHLTVLCGVIAAMALALGAMPGTALAGGEYAYTGHLPGKTWTTGNGAVLPEMFQQYGESTAGPAEICVGPVQYNGGWVFPYGWGCGSGQVNWKYTPINAAAGIDNPNSSEDHFGQIALYYG